MTKDQLQKLFNTSNSKEIEWEGLCHVCDKQVSVVATLADDGAMDITGGAVYQSGEDFFLKCEVCFDADRTLRNFKEVECYSRVVGYLRPIQQWNPGKLAEFNNRKSFSKESFDSIPDQIGSSSSVFL